MTTYLELDTTAGRFRVEVEVPPAVNGVVHIDAPDFIVPETLVLVQGYLLMGDGMRVPIDLQLNAAPSLVVGVTVKFTSITLSV